jgi:hypothetical protein
LTKDDPKHKTSPVVFLVAAAEVTLSLQSFSAAALAA